ncbi:MAG: hypothetical protein EBV34_15720 [Betaproteobacteria bacterium]|nr:hypothetical protein [Betaproteobacteria bacterium]
MFLGSAADRGIINKKCQIDKTEDFLKTDVASFELSIEGVADTCEYNHAVGLVGAANIDAVLISVAGADGNYVG